MLQKVCISLLALGRAVVQHAEAITPPLNCTPATIAAPELFGAEVLSILAEPVLNYTSLIPELGGYLPGVVTGLDFCNVTVIYTHPGQGDKIHVQVWLPFNGWNGRFQGTGGGGWITGLGSMLLSPAVENGYAAASTDGGHPASYELGGAVPYWAQISPGNVNTYLLNDFAYVALNDMTVIGKAVTESFYGTPPSRSYWFGCSTGGRQGLMLAQRYPKAYDGILASAPAINWATLTIAVTWAQQVMHQLNVFPPLCEFSAFRKEAIKACDGLDGVEDGIIGLPELCTFDPHTLVGKTYECDQNGTELTFTHAGAEIMSAVWTGPSSPKRGLSWYGIGKDAELLVLENAMEGRPSPAHEWIRYFVVKDPDYPTTNMTEAEYYSVLRASISQYDSVISANDPDLTDFREAGGKMITWHGLADPLIPPGGSQDYYRKVLRLDPEAQDFYRYFDAPGVSHCGSGPGPYPVDAFEKLVQWVEEDVEPDTLTAVVVGESTVRNLCPFPLVQKYLGGNVDSPESFKCLSEHELSENKDTWDGMIAQLP